MMPEVIGLFYGSDTGTTEYVTELILKKLIRTVQISAYDIGEHGLLELDNYEFLILGLSAWFDGDLQSDLEGLFDTLKELNFLEKKWRFMVLGIKLDMVNSLLTELVF